MPGHKWEPITDLPDDWERLRVPSAHALADRLAWRRERLGDAELARVVEEQLRREWAIETGIIEGVYEISRGLTGSLIEQGLLADLLHKELDQAEAERIAQVLHDHEATLKGLFDFVDRSRELSTSYVKELHAALTQHQTHYRAQDQFGRAGPVELHRGEWKSWPNSPTRPSGSLHEYCPPEQVPGEIERLVAMHLEHFAAGMPPEIEAAWLHHRFTAIHPFEDGNGRVARALATLVLLRDGWMPFTVDRDRKLDYLAALECADAGSLAPMVGMIAQQQAGVINRLLRATEQGVPYDERLAERTLRLQSEREVADRVLTPGSGVPERLRRAVAEHASAAMRKAEHSWHGKAEGAFASLGTARGSVQTGTRWVVAPPAEIVGVVPGDPVAQADGDYVGLFLTDGARRVAIVVKCYGRESEELQEYVLASAQLAAGAAPVGQPQEGEWSWYPHPFPYWLLETPAELSRRLGPWLEDAVVWGMDLCLGEA